MKSLTEKTDEGLVELARQGKEAYVEGLYDCIIGEFKRRRLDPDLLKEKEIEHAEKETAEGFLDTEDYETIAVFDIPGLVKIYQEALAQEGIKSFVPNDYAPYDGQIYVKPNPVERGIKLQVHERDVKRAVAVLSEYPACRKYIVYRQLMTVEDKKDIDPSLTGQQKLQKFSAYYLLGSIFLVFGLQLIV
ncbi:MAG: hypothetical protein HY920_08080 [Elusimicrobia bacterium]|nr:hypothetical protein [Elusimicrobiota bacterium]